LAAFEGVGEVKVCGLEGRMRSVEGEREEGVGSVGSGGQYGRKGKWW